MVDCLAAERVENEIVNRLETGGLSKLVPNYSAFNSLRSLVGLISNCHFDREGLTRSRSEFIVTVVHPDSSQTSILNLSAQIPLRDALHTAL